MNVITRSARIFDQLYSVYSEALEVGQDDYRIQVWKKERARRPEGRATYNTVLLAGYSVSLELI